MKKINKKLDWFLRACIVIGIFVAVSYLIQTNLNFFTNLIRGYETIGAVSYIILAILVTVFAPLTAIPIIPIVSNLYGWFYAGLFSIIGWFIGSIIIFYICRKRGKPIAEKLVSLERISKVEDSLSKETEIGSLILLRMILPVDILSYALGLFTKVSWKAYLFTTFIGILPFAFIIAYLGELPFTYQLTGAITVITIVSIGILIEIVRHKNKKYKRQ